MTLAPPLTAPSPSRPVSATASDAVRDRRQLERRLRSARREALAWAASSTNADRIGAYLTSYGASSRESVPARGRTLADYSTLLQEWGVPGVLAPPDLDTTGSVRWSLSVTVAVLRPLRRDGHLH